MTPPECPTLTIVAVQLSKVRRERGNVREKFLLFTQGRFILKSINMANVLEHTAIKRNSPIKDGATAICDNLAPADLLPTAQKPRLKAPPFDSPFSTLHSQLAQLATRINKTKPEMGL